MLKKKKRSPRRHFKDAPLLKALGDHCQRLRTQRGYSIDRLAKESDHLSASVIHRLETGSGAVTVSALFRYAQALGVDPKQLMDFQAASTPSAPVKAIQILDPDDPRVRKQAFKTLLPCFSARAAAGYFGAGEEVRPEGWVKVPPDMALDERMFVIRAKGDSMLPKIKDGDYLVFRAEPAGTRQGRIVLAQYRGPADPETGGSYTVKQYSSSKIPTSEGEWKHRQIRLAPLNPDYEPILLHPKDKDDFRILAELVANLSGS